MPNSSHTFPRLMMLRMHNLHGTKPPPPEGSDDEEEEDDEEDEEERKPQLELAMVPHYGGINRVRVNAAPGACPVYSGAHHPPRPMPFSFKKSTWHIVFLTTYVLIVIVVTMF